LFWIIQKQLKNLQARIMNYEAWKTSKN
jgi:hypothetical protein